VSATETGIEVADVGYSLGYRDLDDLIAEARGRLEFPQSAPSTGESQ